MTLERQQFIYKSLVDKIKARKDLPINKLFYMSVNIDGIEYYGVFILDEFGDETYARLNF